MIPDRKRISPPEAAKYIGMSESWLSKSRMTGMDAPSHFKIGRRVTYDTADLDIWLAAHRRMNTSEPPQAPAGVSGSQQAFASAGA
jgi:predicted DNA-binding transcriptional regulator AlpA